MEKQSQKIKTENLKKMRLIIGSVLFIFIVLMHAFFGVNVWLIAIPGALMGIDPSDILPKKQ
tara:strand:+ start:658 stop:843 length:186 start_codon:yes stop_codon:yes gene_type:complete